MLLFGVMKGSHFGFGSAQQQVDMHAKSKILSLSYNTHLCLPYLLNDSQTIHSTMHFPLLCVTLNCGDWSDWSISFKAAFVRSVLLYVQPLLGEKLFLTLQKRHLVAKNEFAFSFRPTRTLTHDEIFLGLHMQQLGRQYANISCWRQHETAWDSF